MVTQTNKQGEKCERCTREREREANKESYGSLLIIQHIEGDGDTKREREKQRKQWWIDDPVHDNALALLVDIRLHAFCRCRIV